MSTYMFGLKSPKLVKKVTVLNGKTGTAEEVEVAILAFMYGHADKPEARKSKWVHTQHMTINRLWDKIPQENRPKYAVIACSDDNFDCVHHDGARILFYPEGVPNCVYDTPDYGQDTSFVGMIIG